MSGRPLEFRLLGSVALVVAGQEVVLGATREASLLADLLVRANEVVPTSRLVDDLWRGSPPPGAVATLHTYVRDLRRLLEPDRQVGVRSEVLAARRPGYVLHVEPDELDVWRARRLIESGRSALAVEDPGRARELLAAAVDLWSGPSFGPLASEDHLRAVAAELDELRLAAIEDRLDADLAMGRHNDVCGELESLVAVHRYRERLWAQLVLALYRSGRQADALRAFRRVRRILAEDLGIEPGRRLRNLEAAVLAQEPDLDGFDTAGRGRLAANDVVAVSRQPAATTSFVGRDAELAQASTLLAPTSGVRVVTVTGPGGVGKSRLALRAALEGRAHFHGGAWVVSLGGITSGDAVTDVVLETLGGARQPGAPTLDAVAELIAGRRLLIVLDNCEHVLDAAAACVEAIVASSDSVVLATSRQPLGVAGEHVIALIGLSADASLKLFVDRARAADASWSADVDGHLDSETVKEICARLDRLPLAIELAAARVSSMSVSEIRDRLDSRFRLLRGRTRDTIERHQTLRAAVQWSTDLLDPELRDAFNRLSVFRGGFMSDAAATVCGVNDMEGVNDVGDLDAVDVLDALVLRSMVVADRSLPVTRYAVLDTMREYGAEQLAATGDLEQCRKQHAHHYLDLAEQARRQLATVEAGSAMATLGREWDNLRSAFEWVASTLDIDASLRLIIAVNPYAAQNLRLELSGWAERAIALEGAVEHQLWPSVAAISSGFRIGAGDLLGGTALAERAADVEHRSGRPRGFDTAASLWGCASAAGDRPRAYQLSLEVEGAAATNGDPLEVELSWYFRVLSQLALGPQGLGGLDAVVMDHVAATEARGNPLELACAYSGQLAYALATDRTPALELFDRVQRWAALAGSRSLPANAALLMAINARPDDPVETLAFARSCIADHYDAAHWLGIRAALQPVVKALAELGRHEAAAELLGGLGHLYFASPATEQLAAELIPRLDAALASNCARLIARGRQLDRDALAQRALEAIDEALGRSVGRPTTNPHSASSATPRTSEASSPTT